MNNSYQITLDPPCASCEQLKKEKEELLQRIKLIEDQKQITCVCWRPSPNTGGTYCMGCFKEI